MPFCLNPSESQWSLCSKTSLFLLKTLPNENKLSPRFYWVTFSDPAHKLSLHAGGGQNVFRDLA